MKSRNSPDIHTSMVTRGLALSTVRALFSTYSRNSEFLTFRGLAKINGIGSLKYPRLSYSRETWYSPNSLVITLPLGTSAYILEMDKSYLPRTRSRVWAIRLLHRGEIISSDMAEFQRL